VPTSEITVTGGGLTAERTSADSYWGTTVLNTQKNTGSASSVKATINALGTTGIFAQLGWTLTNPPAGDNYFGGSNEADDMGWSHNGSIYWGNSVVYNDAGFAWGDNDVLWLERDTTGRYYSFYKLISAVKTLFATVDVQSPTYGIGGGMNGTRSGLYFGMTSGGSGSGFKVTVDTTAF
jgi:hypothetical protein